MEIVIARPPNFGEIVAAFPNATKRGVLFAYGEAIYNPDGVEIPRELIAHEGVHGSRQARVSPERWWQQYIADVEFRVEEELLAHQAEYKAICECVRDRNQRVRHLRAIAARLSGPLYGNAISFSDATKRIKA